MAVFFIFNLAQLSQALLASSFSAISLLKNNRDTIQALFDGRSNH